VKRDGKEKYLIVACDGIWDCLSNQACVEKLSNHMVSLKPQDNNLCPPVEKMFDEICAVTSDEGIGTDNMTAILIKFKQKEQ
jgi:serine/threonine protein phosphatase PrpC|tara:strand:- start:124 stop:369 length:246 start_codon:yes stop_codon:yes gene_type:complete